MYCVASLFSSGVEDVYHGMEVSNSVDNKVSVSVGSKGMCWLVRAISASSK